MPQFRVNVAIATKGEIFKASAVKAAATRMVTDINEAIAIEGVRLISARLQQVLQHPTGHYQSRIQVVRGQTYRGISDGGVIYGGWLEGVSSRNRTTRFKGYHTFREIKQQLNKDKDKIAAPMVKRFIEEMGG
ncbi:MAG TPA: hypothetical protein VMP68_08925 [Candidatus Eisenbacteria bacterium]|nr:hypothetical protein [Candidatus Eisenbacteria bacterium]